MKMCENCNRTFDTQDKLCPECRERMNMGDTDWFSEEYLRSAGESK